ncbi:DsbA family protein [Nitrosomonas oligotropha]|uniref:DsbA family protein n=1 Tax=Nitrosomonas oligotropha TaxID=42354 RepID=UPI00136D26A1|nr:DsbA family protein [Nitrosomonas oligotropha]MXS83780.1 DsbA family protein [Nitrosomonas oligotropha]
MSAPQIFYIHDPMCSWCYAFSQSWAALQQDLPRDMEIVYLVGGLAPDTTEPMPLATQKMVQQAWQRIEQTVPGIYFNWDFWSRNTPIRSTYPACRAVLAAKKQRAEAEPEMIRAIQTAYYQQAKNPSLPETLQACAQKIGLNAETFSDDLKSATIEAELQRQMQRARGMDGYSYPSLRLVINNAIFPIAIDYLDHRTMLNEIRAIESVAPHT